jgi:hypothetical protein
MIDVGQQAGHSSSKAPFLQTSYCGFQWKSVLPLDASRHLCVGECDVALQGLFLS